MANCLPNFSFTDFMRTRENSFQPDLQHLEDQHFSRPEPRGGAACAQWEWPASSEPIPADASNDEVPVDTR
eukprot:7943344-Prorocentrum_lima.AAC.1